MKQLPKKQILALVCAMTLICLTGCTPNLPASSADLAPGSPAETADPADSEPKLPEEPSFVVHDSLASAFPSPGDTTVILRGDETFDLTGIPLSGRKEIILNGHTLTLTGAYGVTANAVLDIKPGEGNTGGTLDLTGLTFDFGYLLKELPPETPLVEIRPGITISEPHYPQGVSLRNFPDILTVIQSN